MLRYLLTTDGILICTDPGLYDDDYNYDDDESEPDPQLFRPVLTRVARPRYL